MTAMVIHQLIERECSMGAFCDVVTIIETFTTLDETKLRSAVHGLEPGSPPPHWRSSLICLKANVSISGSPNGS